MLCSVEPWVDLHSVLCSVEPWVYLHRLTYILCCAQLSLWFEDLTVELEGSTVADSVDSAQQQLAQFAAQRSATVDAYDSTLGEGEQLREQLGYAAQLWEVASKGTEARWPPFVD